MEQRSIANLSGDYYERTIAKLSSKLPPTLAMILATEASVFHYLTHNDTTTAINEKSFTYHKKSTAKSSILVFLFLLITETIVVHYLVYEKHPLLANFLTFFSIYALVQVSGILRSMKQRLITMNATTKMLTLRYGFASQTAIAYKEIKSITQSRKSRDTLKGHISLSPFEMIDSTNIFLELHTEQTLTKTYGITKRFTSISLFVDEPDKFITAIQEVLTLSEDSGT